MITLSAILLASVRTLDEHHEIPQRHPQRKEESKIHHLNHSRMIRKTSLGSVFRTTKSSVSRDVTDPSWNSIQTSLWDFRYTRLMILLKMSYQIETTFGLCLTQLTMNKWPEWSDHVMNKEPKAWERMMKTRFRSDEICTKQSWMLHSLQVSEFDVDPNREERKSHGLSKSWIKTWEKEEEHWWS